ncbi:MAG TPA: peptide ABC transporter substrate-binding protein, partial [Candidatus Acetothermia bacterium]|nr:peptide ABC transporter substrate-binding protein [Candidatus Acetothermia bacterium]
MKKLVVGVSLIALLALIVGVVGLAKTVPNPDTLIWAAYGGVDTVDPSIGYDVEAARVVQNVYDRLVRYNGASTDLIPGLATKWDISTDGKTYTFYLRKGVKFHDGTEVTAKDVKFSFDRMLKINKGPSWIYTQDLDLNSVKVIDAYTVQIT